MKRQLWLCSIIIVMAIILIFPVQANALTEFRANEIVNVSAEPSFWETFPAYLWLVFGLIGGVLIMLIVFLVLVLPKRRGTRIGSREGKRGKAEAMPDQPVSAQTMPGQPVGPQPAQPSPRAMPPQAVNTTTPSPQTPDANPVIALPAQSQPMPDSTSDTQTASAKPVASQPTQVQSTPRTMPPPQTPDARPVPAQSTQSEPSANPSSDTEPAQAQPTTSQAQNAGPATMRPAQAQPMPTPAPNGKSVSPQPTQAQPMARPMPPQAPTAKPVAPQPNQAQPMAHPLPPQAPTAKPVAPQPKQAQPMARPMPTQAATARPVPVQSGGVKPIPPNVVSIQQPAAAAPRFVVRNLVITPNRVKDGDPVNISATVANMGTASGEHTMELRIGGEVENVLKLSLDPGSSEIVNSTVTKDKAGNYTVGLDRLRGSFVVVQRRPASISLSNLIINPEKIKQGESVSISAVATNSGETEGTYSAVLRIKDITECVEDITLPPGGNERIVFNITKDAAGFYPISLDHLTGRFVVEMDWTG